MMKHFEASPDPEIDLNGIRIKIEQQVIDRAFREQTEESRSEAFERSWIMKYAEAYAAAFEEIVHDHPALAKDYEVNPDLVVAKIAERTKEKAEELLGV